VESDFEKLTGVVEVISGYSGGSGVNPTYQDYGVKGHIETAKIIYDSKKIRYSQLLEHFWTHIDPLDGGGQFCDRGHEYISAIFYRNQEEKKQAEDSKKLVNKILKGKIKTELIEFDKFWEAEDYHQNYYKRNPLRYNYYRRGCGRDRRVSALWEGKKLTLSSGSSSSSSPWRDYRKPSDRELGVKLTELQYRVTQKDGTERPFDNEYRENKGEGI
jgi:peptide methionine sulfoxide reductase msrA/msrB